MVTDDIHNWFHANPVIVATSGASDGVKSFDAIIESHCKCGLRSESAGRRLNARKEPTL